MRVLAGISAVVLVSCSATEQARREASEIRQSAQAEASAVLEKARREAASITDGAKEDAERIRQEARDGARAEYAEELERQKTLAREERQRIIEEAKAEAQRITGSADRRVNEEVNKLLAVARDELGRAGAVGVESRVRDAVAAERKRLKDAGVAEMVNFRYELAGKNPRLNQYQDEIRAYFQFRNSSNKTITGIQFSGTFLDSFGDPIFTSRFQVQERVAPGSTSGTSRYFKWEDNPFIDQEPFDKLQAAVSGKTLGVQVALTKVSYSDGSVVDLSK